MSDVELVSIDLLAGNNIVLRVDDDKKAKEFVRSMLKGEYIDIEIGGVRLVVWV